MQPIVTENLIISGHRIAYGSIGTGEPIVLIHGTPSSSLIWRNIVPKLTDAGYSVHFFDLLGYGHSERPWDPSVDTSVSAQVPVLEALLAKWDLSSVHIVAHDIGGAIAQRVCVENPTRIRSLTLIDCVSFDSWPSRRTKEQMEAGLESLIAAPAEAHRAHFKDWLLSTVENKERLEATVLDDYLDLICGPVGQASLFQHQVRHYEPKHTLEVADRLDVLGEFPTQILWGENDGWQVVDWAHKLQVAIPGAKLHVLKNCGHFAMEDQPEEVSEKIIDFLP